MIIALMMATAQPAPYLRAETLLQQASMTPKEIFYLVQIPSGTMFCDHQLQRRQGRRFDKRYGQRLNKLAQLVANRDGLGWTTSNDIIVTPCYTFSKQHADKLLEDFESDLRSIEKRYGL